MNFEDLFSDAPPAVVPGAVPPAERVRAVEPPAGLSVKERRVWYVEQQIQDTRDAIAKAQAEGKDVARSASLQGVLLKLVDKLGELQPKEVDDPRAEEKRWRVDADHAVAKIREGVNDARERMAARLGAPFRGVYLELVRPASRAAG